MHKTDTIAAIATALAPGAIGIVRTSGKGCIELVAKIFSRPKALLEAKGNTLVYGWIKDGESRIDEVMLGVYKAPASFTGEDMVEIFCHGGVKVVSAVLSLLLKSGFRQAEKGEYTFRAYINGKTDLTKAEAVREIIDSKTEASRSHAAERLAGNLYKEIDDVKHLIIDTLATIEVGIEYPEDEETIADSFDKEHLEQARDRLTSLVTSWKSEKLYQDGAKVVLAGKTNAGKSRLFNALLKEERAIVSDIEGTTRDWIESYVSFDGVPARLFDTAGIRETEDIIEARGVELTKDLSRQADVILYLVDSTSGLKEEDKAFIDEAKQNQSNTPLILVWNKIDKEGSQSIPEGYNAVGISAKQGLGVGELASAVKKCILGSTDTTVQGTGLGSQRQKESVAEALERIEHAIEIAEDQSYGLDAVVQDLEDSLDSLGEVTGDVTPDDVLGSIFSHFCVGK